jgi:hypothetical protein
VAKTEQNGNRVAVVSNPNAGKNTPRAGIGAVVRGVVAASSYVHRIFDTKSLEELEMAAKRIHAFRPDVVAIVGGDGTIHGTLTRILPAYISRGETPPKIIIGAAGTMNTIATSLKARRHDPEALIKRVTEKLEGGQPLDTVHAHCLRINGEYGFLYGAGMPVNLLTEYYKSPKRGGAGAARVVLETFLDEVKSAALWRKSRQALTRPVHATIEFREGHDPPVAPYATHTAIMAATIEELGLGCRGMPQAGSEPGKFMVRSSKLSFWGTVRNAGLLWAGLPLEDTFDVSVDWVRIRYAEPTVHHVDGDLKPPSMCDIIEIGPLLEFVVG